MTKQKLNDYQKIKRQVSSLEQELKIMKTTDYGMGNDVIFNYKGGYPKPETVVGFDWERYEKKQNSLRSKVESLREVEMWIGDIEDDTTRLVFYLFYIEGRKWAEIAKKVGYPGREDYPRLHIKDKYLREKGIA